MNKIKAVSPQLASLAEAILTGNLPEGSECIYSGRNRVYKVPVAADCYVCVKVFRPLGCFRGMLYALRGLSKAEKYHRNALKLIELGFNTPRPLAFAEERLWGGLRLRNCVYISRMLENAKEVRFWESWPDRDEMVEALGKETARMIKAGVLFRDFSPGNVLVCNSNPYSFAFVDLNRTDFNVKSERRFYSLFKRINIEEEETKRLARAVARAMNWNEALTEKRALKVLRRFLWTKNKFLHPLKNFFLRK